MSSRFDHAWTLFEELDNGDAAHLVVLLLSKNHDYCGYINLHQDAASLAVDGYYTFGKASVKQIDQNSEAITVHHNGDDDELDVVFNVWEREDMVSVADPWDNASDLTVFDDLETTFTTFEDILAP